MNAWLSEAARVISTTFGFRPGCGTCMVRDLMQSSLKANMSNQIRSDTVVVRSKEPSVATEIAFLSLRHSGHLCVAVVT